MGQHCSSASFLFEALTSSGIVRGIGEQKLERDLALQASVFRAPDHAHPAFSQPLQQAVVTQHLAYLRRCDHMCRHFRSRRIASQNEAKRPPERTRKGWTE